MTFLDLKACFLTLYEKWNTLAAKNISNELLQTVKSNYRIMKGVIMINNKESNIYIHTRLSIYVHILT